MVTIKQPNSHANFHAAKTVASNESPPPSGGVVISEGKPMTIFRMMPPATAGGAITTKVNGRSYSCAINSTCDAPDFDADILEANGWVKVFQAGVGTTAQRPTGNVRKGVDYFDTTLTMEIIFDGKLWRSAATGAVA